MNLIGQLGGYEHLNGFYKRAVAHGFTLTEIKEELLKYRRQHNIFEVGDYVVKTNPKIKHAHVRVVISTSPSGGAVLDYQGFPYKLPCVRHATPEEIKAGRRL